MRAVAGSRWLGRCRGTAALLAAIDEDKPIGLGQRIEMTAEHRVVKTWSTVEDKQGQGALGSALDGIQLGVVHADQSAGRDVGHEVKSPWPGR